MWSALYLKSSLKHRKEKFGSRDQTRTPPNSVTPGYS